MDIKNEQRRQPGHRRFLKMDKPLSNYRILDFTQFLSGPYCTMLLGDLGAEVIKVEKPGDGEVYRTYGPKFINGVSSSFIGVNRNKKSIALNLKSEEAINIIKRLVQNVDIVVENFKAGTMNKLGLGYEELKKYNESLIYCSISGFGQTGPYKNRGGFDLIVQGMSGIMSVTGEADGPPVKVGFPIADMGASVYAAVAVLSSIIHREKTGQGQFLDVSMLEASLAWATLPVANYYADGEVPSRLGSASPQNAPYQAFKTIDGYINVGTGNQHLWEKLCKLLNVEYLIQDKRFTENALRVKNQFELAAILDKEFEKKESQHWITVLNDAGIPTGPILDLKEALEDPQVVERNVVLKVNHPVAGEVKMMGLPFKSSELDFGQAVSPPLLGEDTVAVLSALGGYSKDEIDVYKKAGVIGGA
jgi:crotonobetainyl-CoA:carnitine CoA-transferase CaiB-like acyl-CoA transferase